MYFEKLTLILPKFLLHIVKFVWKIYIQEKADKGIHTIYVHLYFNWRRRGGCLNLPQTFQAMLRTCIIFSY